MEMFKPQLEICSLTKDLSRFDGASTSEQTINKNRIEMETASYHFNTESESRTTRGDKTAVKKSLMLRCSSREAQISINGKAVLSSSSEIEELNERLRILEEETETMKQELFESAEVRKKLMNEIYQQFEMFTREFKFSDANTNVNSSEDERIGTSLSNILQEDLADTLALLNVTQ